jgi:hypothetical protein
MEALMDVAEVEHDERGTKVTLRRALKARAPA